MNRTDHTTSRISRPCCEHPVQRLGAQVELAHPGGRLAPFGRVRLGGGGPGHRPGGLEHGRDGPLNPLARLGLDGGDDALDEGARDRFDFRVGG